MIRDIVELLPGACNHLKVLQTEIVNWPDDTVQQKFVYSLTRILSTNKSIVKLVLSD